MGLFDGLFGPTTTTTTANPWGPQQGYLRDVFSNAQYLYNNGGPLTPGFSPYSTMALNMIANRAQSGSPLTGQAQTAVGNVFGATNPAQNYLTNYMTGPAYSSLENLATQGPGQNPLMDATARQLGESYRNQVLPQVMSQFELAGRTGSQAERDAMYGKLQDLQNTLGNVAAQTYNQDRNLQLNAANSLGQLQLSGAGALSDMYNRDVMNQLYAAGMVPQLNALDYADAQQLGSVGSAYDTLNQNQAMDPYKRLQLYQQMISGNYGGTQSQSTQIPPIQQGLNLGAQLGSMYLLASGNPMGFLGASGMWSGRGAMGDAYMPAASYYGYGGGM